MDENEKEEIAGWGSGLFWLVLAVTGHLIDRKVIAQNELLTSVEKWIDLLKVEGCEPYVIAPLQKFVDLIESGGGALGHGALAQFHADTEFRPPGPSKDRTDDDSPSDES